MGFVHSGPYCENRSGLLEFLGLIHAQLTQKVKERKDSPKSQTIKRRRPSVITGLGFKPWKVGEKDQRWQNLEVYSQHPSHQCHLENAMELSCVTQVVEATGESHGYRE